MTKKKDPKDLKPVGRVPELLKRYGYDKDQKKKTYKPTLTTIENVIIDYTTEWVEELGKPRERVLKSRLTITGLMLTLGYCDKQTFYDDLRLKNYPELSGILKRGRFVVEEGYENRLHGTTATGSIFALKNMGWSDRQVIEDTLNPEEKKRLFD